MVPSINTVSGISGSRIGNVTVSSPASHLTTTTTDSRVICALAQNVTTDQTGRMSASRLNASALPFPTPVLTNLPSVVSMNSARVGVGLPTSVLAGQTNLNFDVSPGLTRTGLTNYDTVNNGLSWMSVANQMLNQQVQLGFYNPHPINGGLPNVSALGLQSMSLMNGTSIINHVPNLAFSNPGAHGLMNSDSQLQGMIGSGLCQNIGIGMQLKVPPMSSSYLPMNGMNHVVAFPGNMTSLQYPPGIYNSCPFMPTSSAMLGNVGKMSTSLQTSQDLTSTLAMSSMTDYSSSLLGLSNLEQLSLSDPGLLRQAVNQPR